MLFFFKGVGASVLNDQLSFVADLASVPPILARCGDALCLNSSLASKQTNNKIESILHLSTPVFIQIIKTSTAIQAQRSLSLPPEHARPHSLSKCLPFTFLLTSNASVICFLRPFLI